MGSDEMIARVVHEADMDKQQRWFQEKHFIEDMGLLLEEGGLPRMAGRILGWLLICDPPHQSTKELAEVLHASKASISTMTRLLIQLGVIERVGLPGLRRDHFRIKPGGWSQMILRDIAEISNGYQLIERGLALVANHAPAMQARLKEARDLYAFLEREHPLLVKKWERERRAAKKRK
jgi:DNA-binding transcriptional regulator GbsR (MarR family)